MLLLKSNIEFDTTMEFRLSLSSEAAIEMLSNSISTQDTYFFQYLPWNGNLLRDNQRYAIQDMDKNDQAGTNIRYIERGSDPIGFGFKNRGKY